MPTGQELDTSWVRRRGFSNSSAKILYEYKNYSAYIPFINFWFSNSKLKGKITYVGGKVLTGAGVTGTYINADLTGLSGGIGTAPITGDLIIISHSFHEGTNPTIDIKDSSDIKYPITIADLYADNGAIQLSTWVAAKFMGATPDTTAKLRSPLTDINYVFSIQVFRGVDINKPLRVNTTTNSNNTTTDIDPPSITTDIINSVIVIIGVGGYGAATASSQSTQRLQQQLTTFVNTGTTSNLAILVGYDYCNIGSYNNPAFVGNNSLLQNSVAINLNPLVDTTKFLPFFFGE